ncbi:MAG: signal peptide peptidase SppA [bacterium]|nr:signal peptide peptidase SppA [bacterium]
MKKFWIVFLVIAVFVGGGMGLMFYSFSQLDQAVAIDGGVLIWQVGGSYPEERDDSFIGQVRGADETTLSEVIFSLHRAAKDDRITGLVMEFGGLGCDWAKIEEIRHVLAEFKENDKPVYAYFDGAGTREYALAVMADEVYMSPEANLMVLGVTAQLDFMKDTLDKLGMEADFIHVGKFKSAPERMTRSEASDANREMISSIVDDRFEKLVQMLADGRKVSTAEVENWINKGMFDAETALSEGLIDRALYFNDVIEEHFPDDETTAFADYILDRPDIGETEKTISVIYATGVIMPGDSRFDNFQGKIAGSQTIVEELEAATEDENIDLVILRVDSPGGSAMASDLIWKAIVELKKEKPIIVSMSGMAASGGYYISCLADSIFADPGTLTGSIGVYAGKMSRTGMYEKIGVHREFISRGDNALLFRDEGGFTKSQRVLFQNQMDGFYERFLGKVADGRNMTRDEAHAVAQGRVWTGSQGLDAGLVDGIGGFRRAVDSAKWTLGLQKSDTVSVVTFGEEMSPLQRMLLRSLRQGGMFGSMRGPLGLNDSMAQDYSRLAAVFPQLFDTLRDNGMLAAVSLMDGRPVAMMPFSVEIE